jgi:hypothetical protein
MTFVHPFLLAGVAMIAVPILLHLLVRKKPIHLPFPALRFLRQRQRTNQRRLRLRHLLLLALRMLIIAALCLALARPEIFSERLRLHTDRPVAAILVFDTSYSMQYAVPDGTSMRSRLDEAKRRGQELLAELPEGSQVAILDTAHDGGGWADNLAAAGTQIDGLQLSYANVRVTSQIDCAYELFGKLDEERDHGREPPPQFLYVFSDRTTACWDSNRVKTLQDARDRLPAPGVKAVWVDVGAEKPEDLAIVNLEIPRPVIAKGGDLEVHATVQATGRDYPKAILHFRVDGEDHAEQRPLSLRAGERQEVVFRRRESATGPHHVEVTLPKAGEPLAFTKVRFGTFEVLGTKRQILILSDNPDRAAPWQFAVEAPGPFSCVAGAPQRPDFVNDLDADTLRARYQAVCLFGVGSPDKRLWDKLYEYVEKGGGLVVIPGRKEEMDLAAYRGSEKARELLPGRLDEVVVTQKKEGVPWAWRYEHPFMKRFGEWNADPRCDWMRFPRLAIRYWKVTPYPDDVHGKTVKVVEYAGEAQPVILERQLIEPGKAPGRVLLFTTTLDGRQQPPWNNYMDTLTAFYPALAQVTMGYLVGDIKQGSFIYDIGAPKGDLKSAENGIPLPPGSTDAEYTLCRSARPQGPGPGGVEVLGTVRRDGPTARPESNQMLVPGNYTLAGADHAPVACFSLNGPTEECDLGRVPVKTIEELFGPGAVLSLDKSLRLRDALQGPINLLPWLLGLLALFMLVENLLANKFYHGDKSEPAAAPVAEVIPVVEPAEVSAS